MRAPRLRLISVEIAARVECRDLRRALSAVGGAHRTAWTSEIDTTRVTKIRDSRSSDVQRDMLTDCGSRGVGVGVQYGVSSHHGRLQGRGWDSSHWRRSSQTPSRLLRAGPIQAPRPHPCAHTAIGLDTAMRIWISARWTSDAPRRRTCIASSAPSAQHPRKPLPPCPRFP